MGWQWFQMLALDSSLIRHLKMARFSTGIVLWESVHDWLHLNVLVSAVAYHVHTAATLQLVLGCVHFSVNRASSDVFSIAAKVALGLVLGLLHETGGLGSSKDRISRCAVSLKVSYLSALRSRVWRFFVPIKSDITYFPHLVDSLLAVDRGKSRIRFLVVDVEVRHAPFFFIFVPRRPLPNFNDVGLLQHLRNERTLKLEVCIVLVNQYHKLVLLVIRLSGQVLQLLLRLVVHLLQLLDHKFEFFVRRPIHVRFAEEHLVLLPFVFLYLCELELPLLLESQLLLAVLLEFFFRCFVHFDCRLGKQPLLHVCDDLLQIFLLLVLVRQLSLLLLQHILQGRFVNSFAQIVGIICVVDQFYFLTLGFKLLQEIID